MRITPLLTLSLLGAVALAPRPAAAQISVSVRLGTPLGLTQYDPGYYGDWHTSYRHWTPVTVYYYQGNYYPHSVRGARPVQVYRQGGNYFLPPRESTWENRGDHRYNYKRKPVDEDYQHAQPAPQGRGRGRGRGPG